MAHAPYSKEQTHQIVEQFHRDGYYFFGQVLTPEEVAALKDAMERKYADPRMHDPEGDHIRGISLMRMFEYDRAFRDLIVREPFVSLVEAILGADCHLMSQNALRYAPGQGGGWHVDDRIHFPLPDDVPRHDPRITLPCFVINVLIPFIDIDTLEDGPTQIVPGSHYSGRRPPTQDNPTFEGRGAVSLFTKAGGAYMFNSQVWHRGAPNLTNRFRLIAGATYSQRIIAQRFYPFIDYRMPEHVFDGADARLQRLLGRHEKGAYG
jgi:ectoine hydroxylase-related dioxygenase (phytanoyl-CoA dioxygenase family)